MQVFCFGQNIPRSFSLQVGAASVTEWEFMVGISGSFLIFLNDPSFSWVSAGTALTYRIQYRLDLQQVPLESLQRDSYEMTGQNLASLCQSWI